MSSSMHSEHPGETPVVGRSRSLDLALLVVAWTVDDIDRAAELVGWGVDGLTTHRVAEMRAEFAP